MKETTWLALQSGNLKILICLASYLILNIFTAYSYYYYPDWLQRFKDIGVSTKDNLFWWRGGFQAIVTTGVKTITNWDFQSSFRDIKRRNQAGWLPKGRACCHILIYCCFYLAFWLNTTGDYYYNNGTRCQSTSDVRSSDSRSRCCAW